MLTITLNVFAQETILRKSSKGVLESVEFSAVDKSVTIPASAEIFFKDMLKKKSTDEFRKIQRKQKQKEFVRERFEQYFNGVKVEGAGYNFHYRNGKMFFAHGHYVNTNNIDTKPSILEAQALESFARYKNIPIKDVSNYIAELIIKEIPEKTDTLPALVYKVYLFADYPQNTEIGFIDAHTGNLRMTEPAFIDFSATGTFATRYSGTQQGITHHYQGGFHLVDSTRNAIIHTWNLEGRTDFFLPIGTTTAVELIDFDNNWTQVEHRVNNNDIGLDVQWALQNIYDRLFSTHNINSMDDDGFTIDAFIRDGLDPENAFWNPNRQTLSFGVGGSNFRSLASVDVVAHEFGHGITHFQIGWNNTTDQRAFNEGLSDIWAVIMEQRIRPNSVWQIGEQLTIGYACLRNIQNTNANNAMSKTANTFASSQYNVVNNSTSYTRGGVFSHWFYLLVNGGTGTNDLGRSYSVRGVGMDIAESLIVKAVYDGYLRFTTSYAQIRTSMINAAREIAGTNSYLEHQVVNAWYAVGVGDTQYQYTLSGPTQICNQATYTINNFPSNATVQWSISPYYVATLQNNGETVTVSKLNDGGICVLTANITINNQQITLTKNIEIGVPVINSVEFINSVGGNGYWCSTHTGNTFSVNTDFSNITNYEARLLSWPNLNLIRTNSNASPSSDPFGYVPNGFYVFQLQATNTCGVSQWFETEIEYVDCLEYSLYNESFDFLVTPNPATNYITVSIVERKSENINSKNNVKCQIFSMSDNSMIKSWSFSDSEKISVDISNLRKGSYIIKVNKGEHNKSKLLFIR